VFGGPNDANLRLRDAVLQGAGEATSRDTSIRKSVLLAPTMTAGPGAALTRAQRLHHPDQRAEHGAFAYSAGSSLQNRQGLQYISWALPARSTARLAWLVGCRCHVRRSDLCRVRVFGPDGFHPNDSGYSYLAQRLSSIFNSGSSAVSASCSQMTSFPPALAFALRTLGASLAPRTLAPSNLL
jgi:hypothetical protein